MMEARTLYLMRHAKSAWEDDSLSDHDRPLAPRGRRAAPAVAARMREEGMIPQHVLCSSSARTSETWSLVGPLLAPDASVERTPDLYHAGAEELLQAVQSVGDEEDPVLLLGHNPSIQALAAALAGHGPASGLGRLGQKFPTAAVAEIRFPVARWRHVVPGLGRLERFLRPKDLRDAGSLRL